MDDVLHFVLTLTVKAKLRSSEVPGSLCIVIVLFCSVLDLEDKESVYSFTFRFHFLFLSAETAMGDIYLLCTRFKS